MSNYLRPGVYPTSFCESLSGRDRADDRADIFILSGSPPMSAPSLARSRSPLTFSLSVSRSPSSPFTSFLILSGEAGRAWRGTGD